MNRINEVPEEENFSDNPEENLRMQNKFLKMKMMAESGAVFGGSEELPPEIENQFLKNIIEFEKQNSTSVEKKVKDILGNPTFKAEKVLDDNAFDLAYNELNALLIKHSIQVDFSRERSNRFKYNFITDELFNSTTSLFPIKGMTIYFSYEEFHPDHEMDIKETTINFLDEFLERKLNEETYYFEREITQPDGNIVAIEDYLKRFKTMFEATTSFENYSYKIENIHFDIKENNEELTGMGFSEGSINYEIVFQNGERKIIDGPFKIYFIRTWDVWKISFFYLVGFNMHRK